MVNTIWKENFLIMCSKLCLNCLLYTSRLTPRECLRLQGWADDRIDTVLAIQSDNQAYKQAGNGVTVNVVEAIGRRIAAMDAELRGEALAP